MALSNRIEKVAVVGATGRVGKAFAEALVRTGKHTVTGLTRTGSKGILPSGVKAAPVDYDDEASLVSALEGQQFLVITLAVRVPEDLHGRIVKAAVQAGVPYIMPNIYGWDVKNERLTKEIVGNRYETVIDDIESCGGSYIIMVCGFWYEWSLGIGEAWFGFDIKKREVTFFDDGETKINVSTWDQCGRALAALLSLPESGSSPSVSEWKNKPLYIDSYAINQRDMLDSLHRVLGTTDKDWKISYEDVKKRRERGLAEFKQGKIEGFARAMYSRIFFPSGDGLYGSTRDLANEKLRLPREDIDDGTKRVMQMLESGWNPLAAITS